MKIIVTENQLTRLFESNTSLDNLNNLININEYRYEYGFGDAVISPSHVSLYGDLEDGDINLKVGIESVTWRGEDVTEFANNYALYSGDSDGHTSLAFDFIEFVITKINNRILRLTPFEISEWDVELEF